MENFWSQLRLVLRRLRRTPVFTAIAVITLAVGIGANTAVFSVVDGVLLKALPYPHPEELVGVWHTASVANLPKLSMSPSNYFIYHEQGRAFEDVGAYRGDSVTVTGMGAPEKVDVIVVTERVLPMLGATPMLGRSFSHEEDSPNAPETAILTYSYWNRKFGGDHGVVGKTINADGRLRQIIGVMPQSFRFLDMAEAELIFPMRFDRAKTNLGNFSYRGIARLKPGMTIAQANSDVARMLPIVMESFPAPPGFSLDLFKNAHFQPNVHPLKDDVVGDIGTLLWVVMGSIGLVLLIACANIANLLLVRAEGRQQELAIRSALGATRGRIAGELLFESMVIGSLGCVVGLGIAWGALRILVALAPTGLPRVQDIGVDFRALLFTVGVSLFASLLFGLVPVVKYAGSHLGAGLREGGRSASQTRERHRVRNTLVVVQVSLACVLLICSGLMIRTFRALTKVNPGFTAPATLQTFHVGIREADVKEPEAVVHMEQAIEAKIRAIPGVSSAAMTDALPMGDQEWEDPVFAQDHDPNSGKVPPIRRFKFTGPGYFQTVGTPLLAGREFTWEDNYQKLPVAIISENFAREYWGSPVNALGKQIRSGSRDDWRQIVGVVANVYDEGTNHEPPSAVYFPILMNNFDGNVFIRRGMSFVMRSERAGSQSLMKDAEQAVWSVDSKLPLTDVRTLNELYTRSMARTSFTLTMIAIAGGMALLLGTVGLYGVIAYSVSQRTREIGIRVALGAQRGTLTGMFVRQGLVLSLTGVAAGVAVAFAAMRLIASLLFRVSPVDPVTYIAVCIGLILVSALASYLPARRAMAVDPMTALRTE